MTVCCSLPKSCPNPCDPRDSCMPDSPVWSALSNMSFENMRWKNNNNNNKKRKHEMSCWRPFNLTCIFVSGISKNSHYWTTRFLLIRSSYILKWFWPIFETFFYMTLMGSFKPITQREIRRNGWELILNIYILNLEWFLGCGKE